ncbi:hypothetical protein D3C78_681110 [compost metagenome]
MQELDARQHFHGVLQHRGIDRRCAVVDPLEAAEVVLRALRMLQQHLQHRRHQEYFPDALALDGFQNPRRFEGGKIDRRITGRDPRQHEGHGGQMKHRRHLQVERTRQHGQLRHAQHGIQPQAAVGMHHTLGEARGAAGVHDQRQVLAAVPGVLHRRGVGDQLLERMHASRCFTVAKMDQYGLAPGAGDNPFDQRQEMVVDDQDACIAIVQRIDDLRYAPASVHRIEYRTHPPATQHVFQIAIGVQRQHSNPVTTAYAEATETGGQACNPLAKFAIGCATLSEDGGDTLGGLLHGGMQALSQMHLEPLLVLSFCAGTQG